MEFAGIRKNDFKLLDGTRTPSDSKIQDLRKRLKNFGNLLAAKFGEIKGEEFKVDVGGLYPKNKKVEYIWVSLTQRKGRSYTHYPQINFEFGKDYFNVFLWLDGYNNRVRKKTGRKYEESKRFYENLKTNVYNHLHKFLDYLKSFDEYCTVYPIYKKAKDINKKDIDEIFEKFPTSNFGIKIGYEIAHVIELKEKILDTVLEEFERFYPVFKMAMEENIELSFENEISSELYKKIESLLQKNKQVIFYGPPGTGKTYIARKFAVEFMKDKLGWDVYES